MAFVTLEETLITYFYLFMLSLNNCKLCVEPCVI